MAGSKGDTYEAAVLNYLLGATTPPSLSTSLYWALSSAAYSDAGISTNELSGGGYGRLAVTRNTTNFPAASGTSPSQIQNGVAMSFAAATGAQGTALSAYLMDAAAAGNHVYGFDLSASRTINTGDTASFGANAATFQED